MKQRRVDLRLLGLIAVVVLDLLVVAFLSRQIVNLSNYPFDSDEALHASRGLELTFDLRRGDIGAFLRHSNQQSVYPPGSSWFEALTFLLFGASTTIARLYSLASLFGATIVMYAIGLELDRRNGWLVGLIAVILTLTGQAVLVGSALAMLELPGLLISLAALLAYLESDKTFFFVALRRYKSTTRIGRTHQIPVRHCCNWVNRVRRTNKYCDRATNRITSIYIAALATIIWPLGASVTVMVHGRPEIR